jgi:TonB family protein
MKALLLAAAMVVALPSAASAQEGVLGTGPGDYSGRVPGSPSSLSASVALLTLDTEATGVAEAPPEIITSVRPVVSRIAIETTKEGFVRVDVAVAETGNVTRATVFESYPKDFYNSAVLKAAEAYTFKPRMKDGVPVPATYQLGFTFYSDIYETGNNNSARGGAVRGVSQSNYARFEKAMDALKNGNLRNARRAVADLTKRHDAGDMTVTDAARYFFILTHYETLAEHHVAAIKASSKALMLARFMDNGAVVDAVHTDRIISYAALGQNDNAVDYYDSWRTTAKFRVSKGFADQVEALRAKGWGTGRTINVVHYDDTQKKGCRTC